jgi:hypothetical protein
MAGAQSTTCVIGHLRVSTNDQVESGLRPDGQRHAVGWCPPSARWTPDRFSPMPSAAFIVVGGLVDLAGVLEGRGSTMP